MCGTYIVTIPISLLGKRFSTRGGSFPILLHGCSPGSSPAQSWGGQRNNGSFFLSESGCILAWEVPKALCPRKVVKGPNQQLLAVF